MPYFSRLTDIVSCNLSSILARVEDPEEALEELIHEMNEGAAGADRSVQAANANVANIESEIGELRTSSSDWVNKASDALRLGDDTAARSALERKHEVEDLIAGLEQQLQAAVQTRDHLHTMRNALQARLSDAKRRLSELREGQDLASEKPPTASVSQPTGCSERRSRVDEELEAMRQKLKGGS